MCLLRVLDLAVVAAGHLRDVVGAIEVGRLRPGGRDRGFGQRRGVGTHIGDEAALVEALGHAHGALRTPAQLAAGLLLQGRGHERCSGRSAVGPVLERAHHEGHTLEGHGQRGGGRFGQVCRVGAREHTTVAEVLATRDAKAIDSDELGAEGTRVEQALDIPVRRRAERDPLTLAVDNEPRRDRLHPPGRQAGHDLLPQDRRDLVTVETVEDPTGLLRVDEILVEVAGLLHGALDRVLGDLVEDHPFDGHRGGEYLEQVPGDGLALAVLIRREQEGVGPGEQLLELGDLRALIGVDDIEGGISVIDVDPEPRPGLALVLRGDIRRALRQIADVAHRGLDVVGVTEVALDRLGLGWRLDDHEGATRRGAGGRGLRLGLRGHTSPCGRCHARPVVRHHQTGGVSPSDRGLCQTIDLSPAYRRRSEPVRRRGAPTASITPVRAFRPPPARERP